MASPPSSKKIGRWGAVSYVIGSMVGVGIFIMPISVVNNVRSMGLSLIVWASAGAIATLGAFCYMELGTRIQKSGGEFVYLCHVGWHSVAFAYAICSALVIQPGAIAIMTGTFAEYIVKGLRVFCTNLPIPIGYQVLLFAINCFSFGAFVVRFQIGTMVFKIFACSTIILVGVLIWLNRGGHPANFLDPFANSVLEPGKVVLALFAGLLGFGGWEILNVGVEDVQRPKQTMPFALIVGIAVVTVLYVLMNFAYFVVLSVPEMLHSCAIAMTFAEHSFGGVLSLAMPFLICAQLIGTLNAAFFANSRFIWAMARHSLFPPFISCINRQHNSPRAALFVHMCFAVLMTIIGDTQQLISSVMFTDSIIKSLAMLVLLRLKMDQTSVNVHRAHEFVHVPLVLPILYLAICLSLAAITIIQNFWISIVGLLALVAGLLIYGLFIWRSGFRQFAIYRKFVRSVNYFTAAIAQFIFDGNFDFTTKCHDMQKTVPSNSKNLATK